MARAQAPGHQVLLPPVMLAKRTQVTRSKPLGFRLVCVSLELSKPCPRLHCQALVLIPGPKVLAT